jgi:hypothetical protein
MIQFCEKSEALRPAKGGPSCGPMTGMGGGCSTLTAVVILTAQKFREKTKSADLMPYNSKKSPYNPP